VADTVEGGRAAFARGAWADAYAQLTGSGCADADDLERLAVAAYLAHRAAGSTSVYADCPLQRRLRDVHTLTQHFLVKRDTLTTAGGILAGRGLDSPVF
jgi:indole-3-acetate monooxygenase